MIIWLKQAKIDIWKLSPQNDISFYKVFFDKKHSKPHPPAYICGKDSLRPPPDTQFFYDPLFPKFGTEGCSPQHKEGCGDWYCDMLDVSKGFKKITLHKCFEEKLLYKILKKIPRERT